MTKLKNPFKITSGWCKRINWKKYWKVVIVDRCILWLVIKLSQNIKKKQNKKTTSKRNNVLLLKNHNLNIKK